MTEAFIFLAGVILGLLLSLVAGSLNQAGSFVVDISKPGQEKYRVDLSIPLNELPRRRSITLTVVKSMGAPTPTERKE